MHKIVLDAGAAGEAALRELSAALDAAGVQHKLWIEQPEGIPSCLATAPGRRGALKPHFAQFKLLR